MNVDR